MWVHVALIHGWMQYNKDHNCPMNELFVSPYSITFTVLVSFIIEQSRCKTDRNEKRILKGVCPLWLNVGDPLSVSILRSLECRKDVNFQQTALARSWKDTELENELRTNHSLKSIMLRLKLQLQGLESNLFWLPIRWGDSSPTLCPVHELLVSLWTCFHPLLWV